LLAALMWWAGAFRSRQDGVVAVGAVGHGDGEDGDQPAGTGQPDGRGEQVTGTREERLATSPVPTAHIQPSYSPDEGHLLGPFVWQAPAGAVAQPHPEDGPSRIPLLSPITSVAEELANGTFRERVGGMVASMLSGRDPVRDAENPIPPPGRIPGRFRDLSPEEDAFYSSIPKVGAVWFGTMAVTGTLSMALSGTIATPAGAVLPVVAAASAVNVFGAYLADRSRWDDAARRDREAGYGAYGPVTAEVDGHINGEWLGAIGGELAGFALCGPAAGLACGLVTAPLGTYVGHQLGGYVSKHWYAAGQPQVPGIEPQQPEPSVEPGQQATTQAQ
jgi:hypothetical protein